MTALHEDYLTQFTIRILADAITEATAAYWLRRAKTFEDARTKPGDYTGRATPASLALLDQRLADTAQACRNAAQIATWGQT